MTKNHAPTSANMRARETRFPAHSIDALLATFTESPASGHFHAVSPVNGAKITLYPVTNQITYKHGDKIQHLRMTMDEAKRWAALDILEAYHLQQAAAAKSKNAMRVIRDAHLNTMPCD